MSAPHSLKTTALSWCAKFGLDSDVRTCSVITCLPATGASRSTRAIAWRSPLRDLDKVLAAIRTGDFEPERAAQWGVCERGCAGEVSSWLP